MPPLEQMDRPHTAVVWESLGGRRDDGGDTWAAPDELAVRYVPTRRTAVNAQGKTVGLVADLVTDRPLHQGSLVWVGRLMDLPGTGSGFEGDPNELLVVETGRWGSDLKGRHVRYEHGLSRYGNTLPEAAPRG